MQAVEVWSSRGARIHAGDFEARVQSEWSLRKVVLVIWIMDGQVGGLVWLCSPCTRPGCWLRKRVGLTFLAACLDVECITSEERAPFDDLSAGRRHKNAK